MDVTEEVCESSISTKRMLRLLSRHGLEVVICRRDSSLQQATPRSCGNFGDNVHPNDDCGSNRESINALHTVTEIFRSEYLFDSSSGQLNWSKRDTLNLKNLLQKQFHIKLQSCSRETDLKLRPVGMVNPEYLGTLVAAPSLQHKGCIRILVIAKLDLFSSAYDGMRREISVTLLRNYEGAIYALSRNSLNQWKLEKWR